MLVRAKVRDLISARRTLLDELAVFKQRRNITLTVVFDGGAEDFFPDNSIYRGVTIRYAREGADADARIKELVEASRERKTLHVVTSDRALGEYVKRCGARVINSQMFRRRMSETNQLNANQTSERNEPQIGNTDEWLRYFGVDAND